MRREKFRRKNDEVERRWCQLIGIYDIDSRMVWRQLVEQKHQSPER